MQSRKLRLLVVEDNDDHFALVRRHLTHAKKSWTKPPVRATSLAGALSVAKDSEIDAIILDLSLPDSRPHDTVKKGIPMFPNLPIVLLTSLADEDLAMEALRGGAQDYLDKTTITPELLRRSVSYAIARFRDQERLKKKNKELKLFGHTLAHEIRSPLQIVSFGLEILNKHKQQMPDKEAQVLDSAGQSAERISTLITELLAYADSDEALNLSDDIVCLDSVLKTVIADLFAAHPQIFAMNLQPGLPKVVGSKVALHQVFENLLLNSVRYRCRERELAVDITHELRDNCIEISIRDNGVGIEAKDLPRVFEPFYRGQTPARTEGSGLGLNFCRQTIERHGGEMKVASVAGESTTFTITLPVGTP